MNELALFAGAGGGILGGKLLGWRTVCAVEIDPYARRVLLARQADGCLEPFPIWDDVTTFDGRRWRGSIDVVSGGFPCTDISSEGQGAGIDGARSGLWAEFARIIGEVQPGFVLVENSPMLVVRGLDRVLGDLAESGYDAQWGVFSGGDVGARHERERCWIVAHAADGMQHNPEPRTGERLRNGPTDLWEEPVASRLGEPDGVARRVESRRRAIGNGQVPAVVALAWRILTAGLPTTGNEASMSVQRLETCMANAELSFKKGTKRNEL